MIVVDERWTLLNTCHLNKQSKKTPMMMILETTAHVSSKTMAWPLISSSDIAQRNRILRVEVGGCNRLLPTLLYLNVSIIQ
jgi:hypothetical protein